MDLGLNGRIAFVTGASMGIGEAIVRGLASEGVNVALFARSEDKCLKIIEDVKNLHNIQAFYSFVDFLKWDSIPTSVNRAAKALGGCDILVNCASGAPRGRLQDVSDEALDHYFQVKPSGYMKMARECLPYLEKSDQARIVNIGGHRGREPGPYSVTGSVGNAATISHTKWLANDVGRLGINVNAIDPGDVATYRWYNMIEREIKRSNVTREDAEKILLKDIPTGRITQPEDVANTVIFLASKAAKAITGTRIAVDGGNSAGI